MTEPAVYQGMSPAVMAELLAYIQAFDRNFVPDDVDVQAFLAIARDYRWTHHEALTAIRKWGGNHPEGQRMDANLLNSLIRQARQDGLLRQPVATAFGPTVAEETVRQRVMAIWAQESRRGKANSTARKALVAKHPDLVERFNAIGFMRFEVWNGWIAPATIPSSGQGADGPTTDVGHGYKPNPSPTRAVLVEIVAEAERREAS